MYIVELENGVWLADCTGDPGRTLKKGNAATYKTRRGAEIALGIARQWRPFVNALVLCVSDVSEDSNEQTHKNDKRP